MNFRITKIALLLRKLNKKQNQGFSTIIYSSLHYQAKNEPILDYKQNSYERNQLVSKLNEINNINTNDALFDVPIVI
jgi:hypothetical protein